MTRPFFLPKSNSSPTIYAYSDSNPQYDGLLKIGFTNSNAKTRVAQQYPILKPGILPYKIIVEESAMRNDGSSFTDREVHRYLVKMGSMNVAGEWFKCNEKDVRAAILAVKTGQPNDEKRILDFKMRPEQVEAVSKTVDYYSSYITENPGKTPHFLWNAKMRFGKTFAAYQLAKEMGWKKLLVLTFKPAVQSAWEEDLQSHIDFNDWQFISKNGLSFESVDKIKPYVCFGSFQDFLGKNSAGGIKLKNEWVHLVNWDCVILDEYHYGAWRENAKDLFEAEEKEEIIYSDGDGRDFFDESIMPITTGAYLYLSGTPFRALSSGEFIEEQIFNWTYSDEQKAKDFWVGDDNPYLSLPRMVMLTYQLPDSIREIAMKGEFNEFDLNIFFGAYGKSGAATFNYENEVQKWLDLIRGSFLDSTTENLKLGTNRPPMPFSDARLLSLLSHTFWFLPSVASCYAMRNLLGQRQNKFYSDYKIVVAAGVNAGVGLDALPPILDAMEDPLRTRTITLSCGKLTTGVSVKPWSGILMLRNSSSPETYFQAAFRVQTPWTVKNSEGDMPNQVDILKEECYVFDFAPDRALRQIADYGCRLNLDESNPEKKVSEFINFLPVLAYDGSSMRQINAADILDIVMSGTTATLLARRWESALLVNVDNITLQRLLNNPAAMTALQSIEGFRSLNQMIETIINKSDAVKQAKLKANDRDLADIEEKSMHKNEKEFKTLRKQVQDKLIKFATRIPVFMYLTDFREKSLKDVITQLEPGLFKKVTGLSVKDFELLVSIGIFNSPLMNDAVYKFKRYEDSSLSYSGIAKFKECENIGLFDTVISAVDYKESFINLD